MHFLQKRSYSYPNNTINWDHIFKLVSLRGTSLVQATYTIKVSFPDTVIQCHEKKNTSMVMVLLLAHISRVHSIIMRKSKWQEHYIVFTVKNDRPVHADVHSDFCILSSAISWLRECYAHGSNRPSQLIKP